MNRLISIIIILLFGANSVFAQSQVNNSIYSDNVVVIFDSSGSMNERMGRSGNQTRLALGKSALLQVLSTLPENTNVGIVTFSGIIYPLGPVDQDKLTLAINGIQARGGTPLGHFMKIGADMLLKQREAQFGYGSYRLFVVTDGIATDVRLMNRFAPEIVARGIILDTIGVDMGKDHPLAAISSSYRSANDPSSLQQAVSEVFAEVGGREEGTISTEEAFRELDGFPAVSAAALVGAFRSSGNHPIGTEAPEVQSPAQSSSGSSAAMPNSPSTGINVITIIVIFMILIIVIIVTIALGTRC